jgi:adenylosuccinate synthase
VKHLEIVVGAQYGSEAKGHVTTRLLDARQDMRKRFDSNPYPMVNVRVAGPNAGHTAYTTGGAKYALRQVPVGATRPYPVTLVIAAGSEIDPEVLIGEIDILEGDGCLSGKTLYIDPNATIIDPLHKTQENEAMLIDRIGSTGKGIGAARASRLMRKANRLADVPNLVDKLRRQNVIISPYVPNPTDHVIIEGTQGYGLGLHGRHYPQCTSSDCRAIDFAAMAGINPWTTPVTVWAVARMYPIRVAGNSGPMRNETSWEQLGLPEEKTTVTQKVRRVGHWDSDLVRDAVWANGGGDAVKIALTMTDQRWPELTGLSNYTDVYNVCQKSHDDMSLMHFIGEVQMHSGAKVGMVTTGPESGLIW